MPTRLKHLSEQGSCRFGSPPGATSSTGPDEEQALIKNIS